MSTELKIRRGNTLQHNNFTGANGEVTLNTDTKELHIHDGSTQGGFPIGGRSIGSIEQLRTTKARRDGEQVFLSGYYAGSTKGAGRLVATLTGSPIDDGGVNIAGLNCQWTRQLDWFVTPEMFGAKATESLSDDDFAPIQACIDSAQSKNLTVHFSGKYFVSQGVLFKRRCGYSSAVGATLNGRDVATDGCVTEPGNWYGRAILPIINGFQNFGLKIDGSDVGNFFIPLISNCADGLIMSTNAATSPNMFDTNIELQQIGAVTNAIVFESEDGCVMQGNEIKCNFISNFSGAAVLWRSESVNTPDWDSNKVVLQATDPIPRNANAVVIHNPLRYDINRWIIRVETWCGGMASSAKFMQGKFNDFDVYLNNSQTPVNGQVDIVGSSNQINWTSASNSTSAVRSVVSAPNSLASFNGGRCLWGNITSLSYTLGSEWLNNTQKQVYVYHLLTDRNSNLFSVLPPISGSLRGVVVDRIFDNSGTNANEILIILRNVSGSTITAGTRIDFKLRAGLF